MNIGITHSVTSKISDQNSAKTMGSGTLEVLATPSMIALMENAAMLTVASYLTEKETTVGSEINVRHLKPSKIGEEVTATATLVAIEGRKLNFTLKAETKAGLIGEGTHVRYIVDIDRFMSKL